MKNYKVIGLTLVVAILVSLSLSYFVPFEEYETAKSEPERITNTAYGQNALGNVAQQSHNTAFGHHTLFSNTTGESNVALGAQALYTNTTGANNAALGTTALYHNTTGVYNVAIGSDSLFANKTGSYNTAINYDALHNNTSGGGNTAIGYLALIANETGNENVAVGFAAGGQHGAGKNISGSRNTWLGFQAGPFEAEDLQNAIAIGYQAKNTASNQVVIGNSEIKSTVLRGSVSIGDGTPVKQIHSKTVELDFGANRSRVEDLSIVIEHAAPGDVVALGIPAEAATATGMYSAWVAEEGKVIVRHWSIEEEDPPKAMFRVMITKF